GRRTGLYAVLNTSLNVMGEPIVESPEDARRLFDLVPIDVLIVGRWMLNRSSSFRRPGLPSGKEDDRHSILGAGTRGVRRGDGRKIHEPQAWRRFLAASRA